MKRIFTVSTLSYGATWQSLAWEYIARTGIKNIEVRTESYAEFALIPELMLEEPWYGMWQISIHDLKCYLKEAGLKAITTLANCDIYYREGVNLLKTRMEFAHKLGAPFFVAAPWPHKNMIGAERIVYNHWRDISDYAEILGLKLNVETHGWTMNNAQECLETIKNVNRENFKVCFNTADTYYRNAGLDLKNELSLLAKHIGIVFLKDFKGRPGEWNFPALGDGIVDFPYLFEFMDSIGFEGPYVLQLEGHPGTFNSSIGGYHQDVLKSINYLKEIGVWNE